MVELGNINACVNHEVVPPFLKYDTMISTSDYHRRLDGNKYSDYSGNIQLYTIQIKVAAIDSFE